MSVAPVSPIIPVSSMLVAARPKLLFVESTMLPDTSSVPVMSVLPLIEVAPVIPVIQPTPPGSVQVP
ncbi:MAG: hypothetical protein IH840_01740 [Candidatus Heimdallarchaeota archaeon]|nr:hypothetical protein [Candidatus Heimdallarchaeota archaeon]